MLIDYKNNMQCVFCFLLATAYRPFCHSSKTVTDTIYFITLENCVPIAESVNVLNLIPPKFVFFVFSFIFPFYNYIKRIRHFLLCPKH